jgi:Clr5 domain
MDVGSVNSTPAPAVRYMTADDWTSHREQIALLYRDENKTLKETMDTVEAEHRLKAT